MAFVEVILDNIRALYYAPGKRRGDTEVIRLQKMLENSREMHECLLPDSLKALETNLPAITSAAKKANAKCQEILQNEGSSAKEKWLDDERALRVTHWKEFMDNMCDLSSSVDQEHTTEVEQVKLYYTDIEDRLNISNSKEM